MSGELKRDKKADPPSFSRWEGISGGGVVGLAVAADVMLIMRTSIISYCHFCGGRAVSIQRDTARYSTHTAEVDLRLFLRGEMSPGA